MHYQGWRVIEERFDDVGVSGAEVGRLALLKVLNFCEEGLVDVVVVTRLDRLTRSMGHWQELNEHFKR